MSISVFPDLWQLQVDFFRYNPVAGRFFGRLGSCRRSKKTDIFYEIIDNKFAASLLIRVSCHISSLYMLFCLFLLFVSRLCPHSGMVCDLLLLRRLRGYLPESVFPKDHPASQLECEYALLGGHLGPMVPYLLGRAAAKGL